MTCNGQERFSLLQCTKRFLKSSLPVNKSNDFNDEEIQRTFYQSELQRVDTSVDKLWKIEEILKTLPRGYKTNT